MFKLALNAGHGLHTKGKQTPENFIRYPKPKYLQTTHKRARYKKWIMQY